MKPFDVSMDAQQEANTREFEDFLNQHQSLKLKSLGPLVRSAREYLRDRKIEAYDAVAHRINDTIRNLPAADKTIIIDWLAERGQAYQE